MVLRYFTVQDALWAHFQIAKKVQDFDYKALEQAVNAQYVLGDNGFDNLVARATNIYNLFCSTQPFPSCNSQLGFVLMAAFLKINGYDFVEQAEKQESLVTGNPNGLDATQLKGWIQPVQGHEPVNFPSTVKGLVKTINGLQKTA